MRRVLTHPLFLLAGVSLAALALVAALLLRGSCPGGTVAVTSDEETVYCIDQYEESVSDGRYFSLKGKKPAELVTWNRVKDICQDKGGWLCTSAQWEDACDGQVGPGGTRYPYGDTFVQGRCATKTGQDRNLSHSLPTGSLKGCVSAFGVYDMVGNVWEWADPQKKTDAGATLTDKRGGSHYVDGQQQSNCRDRNLDHQPDFRGTIGFRCCYRQRYGW